MCVKTASNKKFARTEFLDNTDPTIFPKKKLHRRCSTGL